MSIAYTVVKIVVYPWPTGVGSWSVMQTTDTSTTTEWEKFTKKLLQITVDQRPPTLQQGKKKGPYHKLS